MERRLQAFRCAVTTAAGVQLQRASLPKKACTPAALAWLAGQAHPASSSASAGGSDAAWRSGPLGAPPLQRLELASCSVLEENDLAALACCCPQLKSLQLPVAGAAAGSALCSALTQRCRLLTRLTLGSAAGLAEADLALLLRELPALQHLDCSGASGISGAAFTEHVPPARAAPPATQAGQAPVAAEAQAGGAAATAAPAAEPPSAQRRELVLRSLRLDGCNPSNTDVSAIVAACPHLEVLSLRDCRRLTLDTAHVALPSSRNLRQLLLRGAQKVVLGPAPPYGSRPSRALSLVELPLLDPADQQLWVAYICRPSPWVKLQFV